ncbi:MAG: methyl-accepting chemotaxis protein [Gammaproteobacteria bacterium]|nr:methyl-accepting chemotaxis protein [Gammaproteobacteria bacterium]MDH3767851.1 methyl-accepting chemotaxis protein [Gammaproteobacteria bacterium]
MANNTPGEKLIPVLSGILLVLLVLAAVSVFLAQRGSQGTQATTRSLLEREALAGAVARKSQQAMRGDQTAFSDLQELLTRVEAVETLEVPDRFGPDMNAITAAWSELGEDTAALLQGQESFGVVQRASATVASEVPLLLTEMGSLAALPGGASLIGEIQRFELNVQRLQQDSAALAAAPANPDEVATRLAAADDYVNQFIRALTQGDTSLGISRVAGAAAESKVAGIKAIYDRVSASTRESVVTADVLGPVLASADSLSTNSDAILARSTALRARLDSAGPAVVPPMVPLALIGGSLLTFLLMSLLFRKAAGAQRAAVYEAEQNTNNQDAILRLLDELGSLADGDLTVQATVSEDITGAIADSINYAIEALRDLVVTIDEAASQVDEAARQTQASAAHLAQASENQSRQVKSATQSIADMAESIEEVSHNAERSSDVSRHSVEIAHNGGEAVRRTIDGMNTIRETIQETSKRIKRLGESSQEIGNIVELINDIAEQTNILALNASIQASMAGEAGRGFAVVADEVQRLAERSANATKQIEVLVNTIQSDTNEAVVSMERSTTDVVSGALLAENAGSALDEIEKVSNQIASLVQNISGTARTQATAAADMTRNMGVLQEISSQTADGSNATSNAIGKLAEMAKELRRSVAGFTLPEKQPARIPGVNPPTRKAPKPAIEATG